jgi:hypothetical protein
MLRASPLALPRLVPLRVALTSSGQLLPERETWLALPRLAPLRVALTSSGQLFLDSRGLA